MSWNIQCGLGHMTSEYINQLEKDISHLLRAHSARHSALNTAHISSLHPHDDLSKQALLLAPLGKVKFRKSHNHAII